MLPIVDITRFTLQNFSNHVACIIWFSGCNFRCPYCHNPEFITKSLPEISEEKIFKFLKSRIGLLEGVVLSGGECCLYDDIYGFIKKIKDLGFLVKIDTNGTNFNLIKLLVDNNMIDFIGLDYKSPKNKFKMITGSEQFQEFEKTLNFLIKSNFDMEIRTTVHTELLNEEDIKYIITDLEKRGYNKNYYIQNFRNDNKSILGELKNQERVLNTKLINSNKIDIFFRNFF